MNTIFKYLVDISDYIEIEMPINSDILKFAYQDKKLYVWARVDTELRAGIKHFLIYGTGHRVTKSFDSYIDTVFDPNGLVWHIFDNGWDM